jgi:hypothetical protein
MRRVALAVELLLVVTGETLPGLEYVLPLDRWLRHRLLR